MTRQPVPPPANADFPEAPGHWPEPGHVGIAACSEDGARVWVSARRALFEGDDGLTPAMAENRPLTIRVHREDDGSLWAEIDELPGCFASGRDMNELSEALSEAVSLYLSASCA